MPRPRSQSILVPPARSAIFLVLTVRSGNEADVREALVDIGSLTRATGFRVPEAELSCVVGIGAELWDRMYEVPRPRDLHPFQALQGRHAAPSTPGDLLFHIRATRPDSCFTLAKHLMERLRGLADVVDEVHGFRYFDERDMLGFVDGTENPDGQDAADAVVIGEGDPYAGCSYVIVQKYLHDLESWEKLTVEQQERVIGRHKLSDVEYSDADKAPDAHIVVNSITDPDGTEHQIVRENMPFGTVGTREFGTYFIGYSATPTVTERMLQRMFIGEPEGNTDRILEFSTAVTGTLFFVPTVDFLEDDAH